MAGKYVHTTAHGHRFVLGARKRPDDPRQWKYELLLPAGAVDRTQPRSLAPYFPQPPKDQGEEGSCTANSGCTIEEACAAIVGVPKPVSPLSREELYYDERTDEGTFPQDAGAYVADSFDSAIKRGGLVLESVWPYDANPAERPPAAVSTAPRRLYVQGHQPLAGSNYIDGILTALDNKQPLALGLTWYQEFFDNYQSTGVLNGAPQSAIAGGHQISIKGWIPAQGGLVWCQNSWGATSPARTDLHPDAKAGDVFLPVALFQNGVVNEVRAAVPKPLPTPPNETIVVTISIGAATAGQPVTMQATTSGVTPGDTAVCIWDFGDGAKGTGSAVAHTYTAAGRYTVTCVATDSQTGVSSPPATQPVTVAPGPPPSLTVSVVETGAAVVGQPAIFTVASTGAKSPVYAVIYGDGTPETPWQTGTVFSHIYTTAGTYMLRASVMDTAQPAAEPEADLQVVVRAAPPTPGPLPADLTTALDTIVLRWPQVRSGGGVGPA